jgi:ParB family transcriptional regulator, chromosome partitioning protein
MALDLSFKDLADAAAEGAGMAGRPLLIPLSQIEEDNGQPRRSFDQDELAQLADSIRRVGILQPIVVRPGEISGHYLIIMGGRRYRAARLAGLDAVPAIVQEGGAPDRYAQVIENIQRDDLAAAEIAAFVLEQLGAGEKQADIARKLGKPRDWVSRFAVLPKMPSFLQEKLHTSSIRAVYELYQAWRVRPEAVERLCLAQDGFTDAQARGVARELRDPAFAPAVESSAQPEYAAALLENAPVSDAPAARAARGSSSRPPRSPNAARRDKSAVSIVVQHDGRAGRLLTDRPANKGSRFAAVRFFETGETEEVPVSGLRIEEIASC